MCNIVPPILQLVADLLWEPSLRIKPSPQLLALWLWSRKSVSPRLTTHYLRRHRLLLDQAFYWFPFIIFMLPEKNSGRLDLLPG